MTVFSKPLQLNFDLQKSVNKISHASSVFLIGSCFSDNIAQKLTESKFINLANPFGISYNPVSISKSIQYFVANKQFVNEDLFFYNDLYKHWDIHSSFSAVSEKNILHTTNEAITGTHNFICKANFVFITLGTAFVYELAETKQIVANCHKAPANWFTKRLLSHNEITIALQDAVSAIKSINKECKVCFTVSPVRHVRDGVVENNRSKALLHSAIQTFCEIQKTNYFPSYELIIDVLRDYRFFADDLIHPNSLAIDFVWENFIDVYCNEETKLLLQNIAKIKQAVQHKSNQPNSVAHKKFVADTFAKIAIIESTNCLLDFSTEKISLNSNS